jgi:ATPase subunit of ABC transporter with duplicated ATPase domains
MYFVAVELNSETSSTAEVLLFRRGHVPAYMQNLSKGKANDKEHEAPEKVAVVDTKKEEGGNVNVIPPQTDVFTWRDVNYDIEIKGEPRRLLDHVSGYVKPGTLTALMGTSGAGKTTLLDVGTFIDFHLRGANKVTGFGSTHHHGCSYRLHVRQRRTSRLKLSTENWICPAARLASRDCHRSRVASVLRYAPPTAECEQEREV